MKFVYHDGYDLRLGAHVFPSQKFRLIRDRLLAEGIAEPDEILEPVPTSDEDILRVHERGWVQRLKNGTLSYAELLLLEIPYSEEMVRAFWLAAGGTTLAARIALREQIGFNIGGGFHHAFPEHGEGFCAIHDVAVAIRRLQSDGLIQKAMVVDCDVHHGNGTAAIFAQDPSVFTVSLHQLHNYPSVKPPSDLDVNLADGVGDDEYCERLEAALAMAFGAIDADLLVYVAGADPYREDQLGGLKLTMEGLMRRDRLVLGGAVGKDIPAVVALAGGYARKLEDTVAIHCQTARVAKELG